MIIAVDARGLINTQDDFDFLNLSVLMELAAQHPQHRFHFIIQKPLPREVDSGHVQLHIMPLQPAWLFPKFWLAAKFAALVKTIKADLVLSYNRCFFTIRLPQFLIFESLHVRTGAKHQKLKSIFYTWYLPNCLKKATAIAVPGAYLKNQITALYKIGEEKISIVNGSAGNLFAPKNFEEAAPIKEKYTGGAEFFLYAGAITPDKNLPTLLKAFSIFKRRLKSTMKMILAGHVEWSGAAFYTLLNTYKYKDDVVLIEAPGKQQTAELMGAAYAFVQPANAGLCNQVIAAMQSGVPVLLPNTDDMPELSGGAALLFDETMVEDVADKLMRIYKDEKGRKEIIGKAAVVAEKYTREQTLLQLGQWLGL